MRASESGTALVSRFRIKVKHRCVYRKPLLQRGKNHESSNINSAVLNKCVPTRRDSKKVIYQRVRYSESRPKKLSHSKVNFEGTALKITTSRYVYILTIFPLKKETPATPGFCKLLFGVPYNSRSHLKKEIL